MPEWFKYYLTGLGSDFRAELERWFLADGEYQQTTNEILEQLAVNPERDRKA